MNTEDIKQHYNSAAENRDTRLKTQSDNVSQFNHRIRMKVITGLLRQTAPFRDGIDIGTGTGVWAEELSGYADHVIGVDFAEENIRIARENAHALGIDGRVTYKLGDAQSLEGVPANSFDMALQISVLQHLPDKSASMARIHEILRSDGLLIILVHNKHCIYNRNLRLQKKRSQQLSVNEYSSLREIKGLINEAGFEILETRHCWLFFNDFMFVGANRPLFRPLAPLRRIILAGLLLLDRTLGRIDFFSRFFREIVILARKRG